VSGIASAKTFTITVTLTAPLGTQVARPADIPVHDPLTELTALTALTSLTSLIAIPSPSPRLGTGSTPCDEPSEAVGRHLVSRRE